MTEVSLTDNGSVVRSRQHRDTERGAVARLARALVVVIALGSYVILATSYAFPQDLRDESRAYVLAAWCVMIVRTFRLHIGFALLATAMLASWWRMKRGVVTTVPLLAFTLGPAVWQLVPRDVDGPPGEVLRVMTCNPRHRNRDTDGIIAEVVAAEPDIVVFQEYSPHWHSAIAKALAGRYPYHAIEVRPDPHGLAIYSRLPFVGPVEMFVPVGDLALPNIRAVVRFGQTDVVCYGVHLLPPRSTYLTWQGRVMLADLLDHLASEPGPVVVLGDFNFTPDGVQASRLRGVGFREAHAASGWGRGSTWPVHGLARYVPGIRLDQVYVRGGLRCVRSRTGIGRGSDHRPVVADLVVE